MNFRVECPICGWTGHDFLPKNGRASARCPNCDSLERHRLQFFALKEFKLFDFIKGKKVLHVAPERCIAEILKIGTDYISIDIIKGKADVVADLRNLPFTSDTFKLIWVSHVLEHIREVELALYEIKRVLEPDGFALIDVPIYGNITVELTNPGRHGHVWLPGFDWYSRYNKVGFSVTLFGSGKYDNRYRVKRIGDIAICQKNL